MPHIPDLTDEEDASSKLTLKRSAANSTTQRQRKHSDGRGKPQKEFRFHVDRKGRQHFNFEQVVWLDASVDMAHTATSSLALKTLALNLLTLSTTETDVPLAVGYSGRLAIAFAGAFSKQCLLSAPANAWILPRSTVESWLDSRTRDGRFRAR
jgi:hypothetical protein